MVSGLFSNGKQCRVQGTQAVFYSPLQTSALFLLLKLCDEYVFLKGNGENPPWAFFDNTTVEEHRRVVEELTSICRKRPPLDLKPEAVYL